MKFQGKQFRTFDTLETRKDLMRLLERLGKGEPGEVGCARRREFLAWCCNQVKGPFGLPIVVGPDTIGLPGEIYIDICGLAALYDLDLDMTASRLESIIRRLRSVCK